LGGGGVGVSGGGGGGGGGHRWRRWTFKMNLGQKRGTGESHQHRFPEENDGWPKGSVTGEKTLLED